MHQASEQDAVTRTVRSVPDYDGPRGAEKIQVELRRAPISPEASLAARMDPPTEEEERNAPLEGDQPAHSEESDPSPTMRTGLGQCPTCLEFWFSDESHPDPCLAPITCYNCRLPGHTVVQCPQLTTPGYPEPYMRPPYCYNCLKPGHTVGTCPDLSANDSKKPAEAPASHRATRNQRHRSARLGARALRITCLAPCAPPQHPLTFKPLATLS